MGFKQNKKQTLTFDLIIYWSDILELVNFNYSSMT